MEHLFTQSNVHSVNFSIEMFPVKDETKHQGFIERAKVFEKLGVNKISVTCKAEQEHLTMQMATLLTTHTNVEVVPHIIAHKLTRKKLETQLSFYTNLGINEFFVIRGDLIYDRNNSPDFVYANNLVHEIKKQIPQSTIGVAGYPEGHFESINFLEEMTYLKAKVDAGADYIITQLFFDNRYYYNFVHRCEICDINVPVIPGLTYIKNKAHLEYLISMAPRTVVPNPLLLNIFTKAQRGQETETTGIQWLRNQIHGLSTSEEDKRMAHKVHCYTFNQLAPFNSLIADFS